MNVLMISTDRKIFEHGSAVRTRMMEYGSLFNELHIIVFTQQKHNDGVTHVAENVWAYPTQSRSRLVYLFDAWKRGVHLCNDRTFSIVTTQDPFETGLVGFLLSRRFRLPLNLQLHTDVFVAGFARTFPLNRIRVLLARFLLPRASCVRVVLPKLKNDIEARYPRLRGRVDVLPLFVDLGGLRNKLVSFDLRQKFPQFGHILLTISRLTREKRLHDAIDVLSTVREKHKDAGLLILGDGPEKSRLQSYAKKRGVSQWVVFEGWQNDLVPYYKGAHLFLVTSAYEGYGMTLIEAAACGLPLVSTDVGIARDLLGEQNVCSTGDSACLARHTGELLDDNEQRAALKMQIQQVLKAHVERNKRDYLERYRQLLEACGPR